ncbi:MAG: hypothetical protein PWQ74_1257, partial [Methanobacteriaceae archaeon]|nr:hypothetical protein [Methanobacteriaceae archaeon]
KAVNNTAPRYGDSVKFTLTVTNVGPNTAADVTVADVLPSGLLYVSSSPTGSYDPVTRTVTWSLGEMAVGASRTLEIIATVNTTDVALVNTATVAGSVYDP